MTRFFYFLVLLLLPVLVYWLYDRWQELRHARLGNEAWYHKMPWQINPGDHP